VGPFLFKFNYPKPRGDKMGKQKSFDLTTHVRDTRTGEVIKEQTYRRFCSKDFGTIYERPKGSGLCWHEDGTRAPTIAQVKKANEEKAKAKPKVLTTADIDALKNDFKSEMRSEIEAEVAAKKEAEMMERMDDLMAERLGQAMEKLGIGTEQMAAIAEEVNAKATVTVDEPIVEEPAEQPEWLAKAEENVEGE
jgi:hypothetical protein